MRWMHEASTHAADAQVAMPRCGVVQMALENERCVDVTYEDPAEELQALRERMDCERAVRHDGGALLQAAQECVRAAVTEAQQRSAAGGAAPSGGAGTSRGSAVAEDGEDGVPRLTPPACFLHEHCCCLAPLHCGGCLSMLCRMC